MCFGSKPEVQCGIIRQKGTSEAVKKKPKYFMWLTNKKGQKMSSNGNISLFLDHT